jgi:NADH dehydrogenase
MQRPRVVIVGAGFAGLNAGKNLAGADVEITIVDRRNFHLFQPLLYQVATAALNPADIAYPIRSVFRGQRNITGIVLGRVTDIDPDHQTITLDDESTLSYDYLVVATGATHSYFGNDQWEHVAPGLKTVEDALVIRRRLLTAFEQAERHPELAEQFLTFVVVGAGPTGVELAGAVVEIAVHALAEEFERIDPAQAKVFLIEGAEQVLPVYPEKLSHSARRQLQELGVEVRTEALVTEISEAGVTLNDGTVIEARTVLWAAGVKASPLGSRLGADCDRAGRVSVQPDLSIKGHPCVFAIGDLASITIEGTQVPGVAPAAVQQGRHVARQIVADLDGVKRRNFRYRDKGSLATIGRARAVADLPRLQFSGFPAWLAWLGVHIFFLIGFRNRAFVFLSWAWSYVTFRRGSRIITEISPGTDVRLQGDEAQE